MSFYTDFYIGEEGQEIRRLASVTGSDTPAYMHDIVSVKRYHSVLNELKEEALNRERSFWGGQTPYPFPWKTSKTSDWTFLLLVDKPRFFGLFQKAKLYVGVKLSPEDRDRENPSYSFLPWDLYCGLNWETKEEHDAECLKHSDKIKRFELPKTK